MGECVEETRRILVVDDDPVIRSQLRWALRGDYDVAVAATPAEALKLAELVRPHLVTLDLSLLGSPGETEEGLEILSALRVMDPLTKVVIVTASDDMDRASRALALGAFDYYVKPIDLDEFLALVRRALHVQEIERHGRPSRESGPAALGGLIGECEAMRAAFTLALAAAETCAPVLIVGERGTGRAALASVIHRLSDRAGGPFEAIAWSAAPEDGPRAELSGSEQGLDEADDRRRMFGALERASHGTLLLRDVPLLGATGDDLRRYLVTRALERDGQTLRPDTRVIACADAAALSRDGRRGRGVAERLCESVECHIIVVPPLREREQDVVILAGEFARRFSEERGMCTPLFTRASVRALLAYEWSGNVPELMNRIRRAHARCHGNRIAPEDLGLEAVVFFARTLGEARSELEREIVTDAIRKNAGNVSRAAQSIGVSRPTMYDLLRKLGVDPADYKNVT